MDPEHLCEGVRALGTIMNPSGLDANASTVERPPRSIASRIAAVARAFALLVVALLAAASIWEGSVWLALAPGTLLMLAITPAARAWGAWRRRLVFGFVRHPLGRAMRPYLVQCLNRWIFWILAGACLVLAIPTFAFDRDELIAVGIVYGVAIGVLLLLQLVPDERVRVGRNVLYALGSLVMGFALLQALVPPSQAGAVALEPPFRGEWAVVQGGGSALVNHHRPFPAQRHALDLIRLVKGREVAGDPARLESYAAYNQPLHAPADGCVARAVDGRPDVAIGDSDTVRLVGNHVVIDVGGGRYVLMAHLKKGSIVVREGDQVHRGQPVARCGNSGNTSAPHLHMQVQSRPEFEASDLKTYPIVFRDVTRIRWGRARRGSTGDLRRSDRIVAPGGSDQ
jgi:hypothetical protein